MKKIILMMTLSLVAFGVAAKTSLSSKGGMNGKSSLICDTNDGREFLIDGTLFPKSIEVNSDWYNLKDVRQINGSKYMTYQGSSGGVAQLAFKGSQTFYAGWVGDMASCK